MAGNVIRSVPKKTARIGDAHNVILDPDIAWSFEEAFDEPDSSFPSFVDRLNDLADRHRRNYEGGAVMAHDCAESEALDWIGNLFSLYFRSPRFRYHVVSMVTSLRPTTGKRELKQLVAANLQSSYSRIKERMRVGRMLALFSGEGEFIYGDGFYENIGLGDSSMPDSRLLVPVTPTVAIFYIDPMSRVTGRGIPNVVSGFVGPEWVSLINNTTQVYSGDFLFFRNTDPPELSDAFRTNQFLRFEYEDPIVELARSIPGARTIRDVRS